MADNVGWLENIGRASGRGRVSSSCNAIDPVAVHHVDTILVRSFQITGVVGVGFCAITSVAGPTYTRFAREREREREKERRSAVRSVYSLESLGSRAPPEMQCRLREIGRYSCRGNTDEIYVAADSESSRRFFLPGAFDRLAFPGLPRDPRG